MSRVTLRAVRSSLLGCFLASTLACGGALHYDVPSSSLAPGADAQLTAEVSEKTHSSQIQVKVSHLPPAGRVVPDKEHYVLWQRPGAETPWARVGKLHVDPESREGMFEGSVPETRFELWITAEENADASEPSSHVVFSQLVGD